MWLWDISLAEKNVPYTYNLSKVWKTENEHAIYPTPSLCGSLCVAIPRIPPPRLHPGSTPTLDLSFFAFLVIYLFIYLFIWERESVQVGEGDWGRENPKQAPRSARSPIQGLIPQPWDHDLSWNQSQVRRLTDWGTQAPLSIIKLHVYIF